MIKLPDWLAALIAYALDRADGRQRAIGAKEADDAANAKIESAIAAALAAGDRVDADDSTAGGLRDDDGFERH